MLFVFLALTFAFGLLCWIDLHKGIWVLTAVLPSYLLRTELFHVPTTLLELLVLMFLFVWFLKRKKIPFSLKKDKGILIPIILLVLASTISIVTSIGIVAALGIWKAYFIEPILLFFVLRYEIQEEKLNMDSLFTALGVTALILALVAIVQWFTGAGIPIPWDIERRVTSVFDYPNALGLFLGPIVIIGALQIWKRTQINRPIYFFWIITTLLSSIAILLAETEAAVVAVVATLFLAGIWNPTSRKKVIGIFLVGGVLLALSPYQSFIIQKLTLQDFSGGVRLSQWSETIVMLKDHWMFGAGLAGYRDVFAPYHLATQYEVFQYPHTILFNIWVELGLLGVLAFLLLAWRTARHVLSRPFTISPLSIAFLALVEMIIHGLVDVPYFKNDLAILTWILLAIIFSYASDQPSLSKKKH
ncbi:O-antigen ligase family protein [Candidatus Uhrbacteria bacterium]|nr:O-antigen ligase family protein [Candidatus Uhrbacteria bacterium]